MSAKIEDFVCPCCTDYALQPILQCTNSHIICETCKVKLKSCPLCRVDYGTNIRNYKLEKLALKLKFPCSNQCYGCKQMMGPVEKPVHEQSCEFMQFRCPLYDCTVHKCCCTKKLDTIADHLVQVHLIEVVPDDALEFYYNNLLLPINYGLAFLMECFNEKFFVYFEPYLGANLELILVVQAQMIGFQTEAEKFELVIMIENCDKVLETSLKFESITNSDNQHKQFVLHEVDIDEPSSFNFLVKRI